MERNRAFVDQDSSSEIQNRENDLSFFLIFARDRTSTILDALERSPFIICSKCIRHYGLVLLQNLRREILDSSEL